MHRILLLTHTWGDRAESDFVAALTRTFDVVLHDVDRDPIIDVSMLADCAKAEVVMTFWRFRQMNSADVAWTEYHGTKILVDHDSFLEFTSLIAAPPATQWSNFLRRNEFDHLIVSGQRSRDHFSELGFKVSLVHKAYEPTRFFPSDEFGGGLCYTGTRYRSRAAMLRTVERAGVPFDRVQAPYSSLPDSLRRYSGLLTTTMGAVVRFGKVGRGIERLRPGSVLHLQPSPEPMMKHFEASATGCAVFSDPTPDFAELGFVNGESFVEYTDFDELVDKARFYLAHPAQLRQIGKTAAALCAERHTWDHRARQIEHAVFGVAGHGNPHHKQTMKSEE